MTALPTVASGSLRGSRRSSGGCIPSAERSLRAGRESSRVQAQLWRVRRHLDSEEMARTFIRLGRLPLVPKEQVVHQTYLSVPGNDCESGVRRHERKVRSAVLGREGGRGGTIGYPCVEQGFLVERHIGIADGRAVREGGQEDRDGIRVRNDSDANIRAVSE